MIFKVLIADDVPKFREYMRNVINWNEFGFDLVGEARNGIEALDLTDLYRPHIALLDIKMPLMDGLDLVEKLKERYPDICIALITGNGEFEYARKALKLGVEDYILKPFNQDELLHTLLMFKQKLQKMRYEEEQEKNDEFYLKERFLNTLVEADDNVLLDDGTTMFQRYGIDFHSPFFIVASIEIDNLPTLWKKTAEIALWKFAISNVLEEIVPCNGTHLVFKGPEGRIISIINFINEAEMNTFRSEYYRSFCEYVKKYFRFSVTVGLGRIVNHLSEIRVSYLESLFALQHKLIEGPGGVIEFSLQSDNTSNPGFYEMKLNEQILMALRRNDVDEIRRGLLTVREYIKDNKLTVDLTFAIIMVLISICLSYITEMGGSTDAIIGRQFDPYHEVKKFESLEKSFAWLLELFEKTAVMFSVQKRSRGQKIVDNIRDYIDAHYMDAELSVDNISKQFYLDASYIRKAFVKELDKSVSEYIIWVRMKEAKELLDINPAMKLSELTEAVGYNDTRYFCKCFKKRYGVLPSEYKNQRK
ncbi:response regulator [Cohnella silvisoli]|uniref:Response regulator n=1 Tax=Cohnella silvisoli TaxID=2873699 RepID=A0ABV1KVV5_9BACL|nr:response regulator [Cohnella silvisoli]MCD9023524.1 response regulator [Cohnella silvisoli]